MILTVCPNTALDIILFIDEWTAGTPMRTTRVVPCVGGKGLDSAVVLGQLGVNCRTIGFFAGSQGKQLLALLDEYGVNTEAVWVDGENRVSYVVADAKSGLHSHIITGEVRVNAEQISRFLDIFSHQIRQAAFVVMAGSLPASLDVSFYRQLVLIAREAGVPSLVDSQKAYMCEAISARPLIAKMNWEEFEWTFEMKAGSLRDLIRQAREVQSVHRIRNLVLTLGEEGILALTEEGNFLARAPRQQPVNAAGAGDAVSSVLAWKLSCGSSWADSLKMAGAVSAASVLTERTGDVKREDIERILPMVKVDPVI